MSRTHRADSLVRALSEVHRVGRKLATMFVSLVSLPELAPGATPWFPLLDGNQLVVVDTNVAGAVALLAPEVDRTYVAQAKWIREAARSVELERFGVPKYSPRMVQQSLYWFSSRSNREANSDPCRQRRSPCDTCVPGICGFFPAKSGIRDG